MNKKTKDRYSYALKLAKNDPDNFEEISDALEQAHADGDPRASYALATWYLFGHGGYEKDLKNAVALLKIAAKNGISAASYDLGVCYEKGNGIKKNEKKAYLHYLYAALNGDDDSIPEVARCLYYGIGVERDKKSSKIWFCKAEALGLKVR